MDSRPALKHWLQAMGLSSEPVPREPNAVELYDAVLERCSAALEYYKTQRTVLWNALNNIRKGDPTPGMSADAGMVAAMNVPCPDGADTLPESEW